MDEGAIYVAVLPYLQSTQIIHTGYLDFIALSGSSEFNESMLASTFAGVEAPRACCLSSCTDHSVV